MVRWKSLGEINSNFIFVPALDTLKTEIKEKRLHLRKRNVVLHQDNAGSYTFVVAMVKFHKLWFELEDYPPCLHDLPPLLILFPNLKIWFERQRFLKNEDVKYSWTIILKKSFEVLFRWLKEMGVSLIQVCRDKRILCREINRIKKNICFIVLLEIW